MNTLEEKAWRALAGTKGIGPKTLWLIADYLASQGKTASWLLENPEKSKDILPGNKTSIVWPDSCEYTTWPMGKNITMLHPQHPDFPQRIMVLKDKLSLPALLYASGNMAILNRPAVAIVGKRSAGATALATAEFLAGELAAKEINVTSGYAAGIDSAAHLAALRAGGTTSMVLAEGIQHFEAKPGLKDYFTAENNLVISQFEPEAQWAAYMAMARNKLVCAISAAVVVIVSGPEQDANGRNSGTFNTGMAAMKMGIPIFVVSPDFFATPPPGNRELIKKGCLEWDPASGAALIIAACSEKKTLPRQLNLFEKICD
jgi:DNA processing protein